MVNIPIKNINARQILDSRGNPTLEVTVEAGNGKGVFGVPSGASTGSAEAWELRDGGKDFGGKGVTQAIKNVNTIIAKNIRGMNVYGQKDIDDAMIALDGTPNKKHLGANAILGVSGAVVKAAASAKNVPVYKYIAFLHKSKGRWSGHSTGSASGGKLPKPMMVMIEGGAHGDTNLNLQEVMIMPRRDSITESIQIAAEVFYKLKSIQSSKALLRTYLNSGIS